MNKRSTAIRRRTPKTSASYWADIERSQQSDISPAVRSNTRSRLLATALEVFAQQGFKATTMRDLAVAVGIKAPAIYNHFTSKEELLCEALLWAMDHFNKLVLPEQEEDPDPLVRLHGILDRHLNYQFEHAMIARAFDTLTSSNGALLVQIGKRTSQEELKEKLRRYLNAVTAEVKSILERRPGDTLDSRYAARAITTMYDTVVRWYSAQSPAKDEKRKAAYWELTLRMLNVSNS